MWKEFKLWQKMGTVIGIGVMMVSTLLLIFGGGEKSHREMTRIKQPPRHTSGIYEVYPGQTINKDIEGKSVRGRVGERFVGEVIEGKLGHLYFVNDHLPPLLIKEKHFRLEIVSTAGDSKFRLINTSKDTNEETKYLVRVQVSL